MREDREWWEGEKKMLYAIKPEDDSPETPKKDDPFGDPHEDGGPSLPLDRWLEKWVVLHYSALNELKREVERLEMEGIILTGYIGEMAGWIRTLATLVVLSSGTVVVLLVERWWRG